MDVSGAGVDDRKIDDRKILTSSSCHQSSCQDFPIVFAGERFDAVSVQNWRKKVLGKG
jgi:hypothetical protein